MISTERKQEIKTALETLQGISRQDEIDLFMEDVCNLHPTLQQNLGRMIYMLFLRWARIQQKHQYDARNAATVEWASEVLKKCPSNGFPYI